MNKSEMSRALLDAKKAKGLTRQELSARFGMSVVWLAGLCYGARSAAEVVANKVADVLDVGEAVMRAMTVYPVKGNSIVPHVIPTGLLVYRFYEMLAVYGFT